MRVQCAFFDLTQSSVGLEYGSRRVALFNFIIITSLRSVGRSVGRVIQYYSIGRYRRGGAGGWGAALPARQAAWLTEAERHSYHYHSKLPRKRNGNEHQNSDIFL